MIFSSFLGSHQHAGTAGVRIGGRQKTWSLRVGFPLTAVGTPTWRYQQGSVDQSWMREVALSVVPSSCNSSILKVSWDSAPIYHHCCSKVSCRNLCLLMNDLLAWFSGWCVCNQCGCHMPSPINICVDDCLSASKPFWTLTLCMQPATRLTQPSILSEMVKWAFGQVVLVCLYSFHCSLLFCSQKLQKKH